MANYMAINVYLILFTFHFQILFVRNGALLARGNLTIQFFVVLSALGGKGLQFLGVYGLRRSLFSLCTLQAQGGGLVVELVAFLRPCFQSQPHVPRFFRFPKHQFRAVHLLGPVAVELQQQLAVVIGLELQAGIPKRFLACLEKRSVPLLYV